MVRAAVGLGSNLGDRLGRGIPIAGGFIGAGVDAWMMNRIADHAMKEFPEATAAVPVA